MDTATFEWQMQLKSHFSLVTIILDTLLFAYNQAIFAKPEYELQTDTVQLGNKMATYNLEISYDKRKNMAFRGKDQIRSKTILNKKTTEDIENINYLGCDIL
jgi:hypothetical protein